MGELMIHRIASAMVADRLSMAGISFQIDPQREELQEARAAVIAMKQPTEAMLVAAAARLRDPSVRTFRHAAQVAWEAMIEASLDA